MQRNLRSFFAVGIAGSGGGSTDAPNPGAGGAHMHPARRPFAATRRLRRGKRRLKCAQVLGRPMDGVLEVVGRPGQDLEDAVERRVRLCPVDTDCQAVDPRNRVRNVGLRGDPIEDRPPGVPGCQGPEGGEHPLAGGIVDEGHPVLAQVLGEGDHRQDLGQDLQHVDIRPPGIELAYEPGRHRAGVIPGVVPGPDDVAPTIGAPVRHWGARRHPARLVAELALQEEGVGVDHTVNRPCRGKGDKARWCLLKKRCRGQQHHPQARCQVAPVARLGARPRIDGRQGRTPHLAKAVGRFWAEARVAPVHLHALYNVGPLRSLRLGLLSPEAHEQEEVGEATPPARSGESTPLKSST